MKKFIQWLVYSSADPTKYSATLKGVGGALIVMLTYWLNLKNLNVGQEQLNTILDSIIVIVQQFFGLVATSAVIFGGVRKIWMTVRGTNRVVAGV